MTARTALWRLTIGDHKPTEYTSKPQFIAAIRSFTTVGATLVAESYNQFTGQWDPWEQQ